jgi:hypothetical protein
MSSSPHTHASQVPFQLERDAFGHMVFIDAQGLRSEGCVPVRAFPIAAPGEGLSLVGTDGRELAWIDRLDTLPEALRLAIEAELAQREFMPEIRRIHKVSTFSTPSVWEVDTDRGAARLELGGEEDIRRLPGGALLIADAQGVQFKVPDLQALDRASKRLLERFL